MIVDVKKLSHSFGGSKKTFSDVSFSLEAGQMFGILGDSGCGKTTLLRCISGLEKSCEGEIYLRGNLIQSRAKKIFKPAHQRKVGFVFQDFALFPHLTVTENILFGISKNKNQKEELQKWSDIFGLRDLLNKYPHNISGGQKQRVAFARALAPMPDLLLLDEAFSSLDDNLRQEILDELKDIFKKVNTSVIFVTHNEFEIFQWADQAGVMSKGALLQVGSVSDLYHSPENSTVAKAFGRGSFISAKRIEKKWHTAFGKISCNSEPNQRATQSLENNHGKNQIFIRPEEVRVNQSSCLQRFQVIRRQDFGAHQILTIQDEESKEILLAQVSQDTLIKERDFVSVGLSPLSQNLFPQAT